MGRCFMCDPPRQVPDEDFAEHMEEHGIDVHAEAERWADGEVVVIDETLEPGDFR